jgi:hypothetical protein
VERKKGETETEREEGGPSSSQTTVEKAAEALAAALSRDQEEEGQEEQPKQQNEKVVESGGVRVVVRRTTHHQGGGLTDIFSAFGAVTDADDFERDNHFIVGIGAPQQSSLKEDEEEKEKKVGRRRSMVLTSSEGLQLECSIPVVEKPKSQGGEKSQREGGNLMLADLLKDHEEEEGDDVEVDGGHIQLAVDDKVKQFAHNFLGEATVNTCHKKLSGWWTYELCPLAHIKQYHDEHGKIQSSFSLGIINTEKTWNITKASFSSDRTGTGKKRHLRSISFAYDHGTSCDLNGIPRETIVNFYCSPNMKDAIKQVTETSTCSYVVDFESKELCKHEEFQQKESDINHIECSPLLA